MIKWINANLSFKNKEILKDLNLTVNSGEKILLKTKSGSGKTTLLKTVLGIKQLDSGSIFINNRELNSKNISDIRGDIFYLDQKNSLPELNVEEFFIELFHYHSNRTKTLDINRIKQLSTEFQLDNNILESSIKDLSGGERQRLAIITGIVLDKPIWLLDEPTSALDMELKELVVTKIKMMNITAIIISHDKCWEAL